MLESVRHLFTAHQLYDLRIELEEGTTPPFGPIYSLSPYELRTLHEFIDEHLAYGFIRPTCSLCGAPVLFIKKKDGSLRLCVDFQGLNQIMKKDRYCYDCNTKSTPVLL